MKMNLKIVLFGILVLPVTAGFGMGKSEVTAAAKPAKLRIEDGESLHYGVYKGGEKISDTYVVTRIVPGTDGNDLLKVSLHSVDFNDKLPLPADYTKYEGQMTVSMNRASFVEYHADRYENYIANQKKGDAYLDYYVDFEKHVLILEKRVWDGYELKSMKSRVNLKPEFPVWDVNSIVFIGARFLDTSESGLINLAVPEILKDALPAFFKILNKEKVTTSLGEFDTTKIGLSVSDPVIGLLLQNYSDKSFAWMENSERRRIIQIQDPMGPVSKLEGISNVLKNGNE